MTIGKEGEAIKSCLRQAFQTLSVFIKHRVSDSKFFCLNDLALPVECRTKESSPCLGGGSSGAVMLNLNGSHKLAKEVTCNDR